MREEIKLVGAFSLVGLGIGLGVVLFEADPPQPKPLIVLYYGISAAAAGPTPVISSVGRVRALLFGYIH